MVGQPSAISATLTDPAGRIATDRPAAAAGATMADASPQATIPKSNDTANGADPMAAVAAGSIAAQAANSIATSPGDPKPRQASAPQSGAVSGVGKAPANQVPDAPSDSTVAAGDDASPAPEVQSARQQRANSAADSLSQSGPGNSTTTAAQPGGSNPAQAAAPQATLHNPQASGAGSSTAPTADTNASQVDRVRFVQRVEQVFQDLNGQGGSIRLRLSPPELGSLHIEISVSKGELNARVQADTPAARNILLDNLPALRERLAQHDIKVQSFDVDLMDRSNSGMSNQSSQNQNPWQHSASGPAVRAPLRGGGELPATAAATTSSRPATDGGRLNVVV